MIFHRVAPNSSYRALRFLSELEHWEIGLSPFHNGVRLRMGKAGRPPSVLDVCLGHQSALYSPVLLAVLRHLEPIPESATASEIDEIFPWAGTRPNLAIHLSALLAGQLEADATLTK